MRILPAEETITFLILLNWLAKINVPEPPTIGNPEELKVIGLVCVKRIEFGKDIELGSNFLFSPCCIADNCNSLKLAVNKLALLFSFTLADRRVKTGRPSPSIKARIAKQHRISIRVKPGFCMVFLCPHPLTPSPSGRRGPLPIKNC